MAVTCFVSSPQVFALLRIFDIMRLTWMTLQAEISEGSTGSA